MGSNLNSVCLYVPPGNLRIIEQHTPAECPLNPITFLRGETVRIEHLQRPLKQPIILRNLRFDHPEPGFQLDWAEKVCLLELERASLILPTSNNPVPFSPFLQMLGPDVASCRDPIPSCALEFEVVAGFIDCVRANAILICRVQFEQSP